MSRQLNPNYVFDASEGTIVFTQFVSGALTLEMVFLITNVTTNEIIFLAQQSGMGGTVTPDAGGDILTLDFDTSSMSDTDRLQIMFDEGDIPIYALRDALRGDDTRTLTDLYNKLNGTLVVNGSGVTQPVSGTVTINAIPAGTNNIGDVDVLSLPEIPAGTNNIGDVDVLTLPALPAGTNNIGDVDVLTLPSIPAGSNNIGDVDIASIAAGDNNIGNVDIVTLPALVTGTAIIGKVGIDQTTPGTTNGVQVNAALPAGTNAIGKLAANSGVDIGDVDVTSVPADPFGANADAAVAAGATGSIQAKLRRLTQGVEDLKTLIVLGAGNNNIGDVDVASIAAGTNLIGKTAAGLRTDALANGTTDVTPKFAKIDRATNADGAAVVNIVSLKKIRVLTLTLVSAGTVSIKWQSTTNNSSGSGSNTDLTGLMSLVANTGMADVFSPVGLFETVAGEGLKLNLNAAVQVSGYLTYVEI